MRENKPSQALSRQLPRRGSFWPSVGQLRDNGEDLASFPLRSFREKGLQKRPQAFLKPEYKIIFPLKMARAQRKPFQIVFVNYLQCTKPPRV